jgi:hypothetical protein
MTTTGCLTDCSLTEIFQFIEKGNKTGLLTICVPLESQATLPPEFYIWIEQGCIVAVANRLDQQGLVSLIEQGHLVSDRVLARLDVFCPIDQPLGLCLKNQGAIQSEQLTQLFHVQVLQQVLVLCQLQNGQFKFEQNVPIPAREMTGLSVPIIVVRLLIEAVNRVQQIVGQFQSQSQVLQEYISIEQKYQTAIASELHC